MFPRYHGYSSLVHLNRFPVDVVKIDQTFTAKVADDQATQTLVGKVIELAHLLNIHVVVEGVETIEQLRQIEALGGESCQGFYFARPMPADTLDLLTGQAEPGIAVRLPVLAPL